MFKWQIFRISCIVVYQAKVLKKQEDNPHESQNAKGEEKKNDNSKLK